MGGFSCGFDISTYVRVWILTTTGFRVTMREEFESDDLLPADSIVKKCSVSLGGFEEVIQCALFVLVMKFVVLRLRRSDRIYDKMNALKF